MQVEEKFNSRRAAIIKTTEPAVHSGPGYGGVQVRFFEVEGDRHLSVFMSPDEALHFAEYLLRAVRNYRS